MAFHGVSIHILTGCLWGLWYCCAFARVWTLLVLLAEIHSRVPSHGTQASPCACQIWPLSNLFGPEVVSTWNRSSVSFHFYTLDGRSNVRCSSLTEPFLTDLQFRHCTVYAICRKKKCPRSKVTAVPLHRTAKIKPHWHCWKVINRPLSIRRPQAGNKQRTGALPCH